MRNKVIIAVLAILALFGVAGLSKTFIINRPNMKPQEIVRKYIDNINENDRAANEKYVTKEFIDKSEEVRKDEEEDDDTKLITTFKEERIDGSKATVVHEIDAGILKMNVEFKLIKDGDWLKGYSWKIDDVITPDFGDDETDGDTSSEDINWIEASINDSIELATVKYTVLESSEKSEIKSKYEDEDSLKASSGNKFVVLKFKVENTTKEPTDLSSSDLFTLVDSEKRRYNEYDDSLYEYFEDLLIYDELNPNVPFTGYSVFEIPSTITSYGVASCKKDTSDCYLVSLK